MEFENRVTPLDREELFKSMEHFKNITWAPKRDRSKSMFARLPKKRALMNPKRLSFSAPFDDEGEDGVLARPIEYPVEEMSGLKLSPQNTTTPVNRKVRSSSEITPTDLDERLKRCRSRGKKPGVSENITEEHCFVQAKRRIRLDTNVETKLKVMCKNIR